MRQPNLELLRLLVNEMSIAHDDTDYKGRNAFSIGIDWQISKHNQIIDPAIEFLMFKGTQIDLPNEANETPFLKCYNA